MLKPKKQRPVVWSSPMIGLLVVAAAMVGIAAPGPFQLVSSMLSQGGSAFLLLYIVMQLLVGVPLMMGWLWLGRSVATVISAKAVIEAVRDSKLTRFWGWLGPFWQLLSFLFLILLLVFAANLVTQAVPALASGGTSYALFGVVVVLIVLWLLGAAGPVWQGRMLALLSLGLLLLSTYIVLLAASSAELASLKAIVGFRVQQLAADALSAALSLVLLTSSLGAAGLWVIGRYLSPKPASLALWSLLLSIAGIGLSVVVGAAIELGNNSLLASVVLLLALIVAASVMAEAVVVRADEKNLKRPLGLLMVLLAAGLLVSGEQFLPQSAWLQPLLYEWLMPIAVLLLAILIGWVLKETKVRKTMAVKRFPLYLATRALLRLLVPIAAIALMLSGIGLW